MIIYLFFKKKLHFHNFDISKKEIFQFLLTALSIHQSIQSFVDF